MKIRANLKNPMKQILSDRRKDKFRDTGTCNCIVRVVVLFACCFVILHEIAAQDSFEQTAPGRFRIEFSDKDNNPFSILAPEEFLSEQAIARRQRQGIPLFDADLPVTPAYIDSLKAAGARILTRSKWFNAVTIQVFSDTTLGKIAGYSFVKKTLQKSVVQPVANTTGINSGIQSLSEINTLNYGPSVWQTMIHNGHRLHNRGYTGQGICIAVIDAGFYHVDQLPVFSSLWENGQILGTHDFVIAGNNVFNGHSHGMVVLSIIGGNLAGELVGTAPGAEFWLLRSEDTGSEYLIEEDNWISAAEYADSAGADIINTSLGYSEFDASWQDHTYSDMDGNTTRISRAADMAAARGMVVVVSAGNQGDSDWKYISSPADADSVLAVGAIDQNGYLASFSSRGPSSDGNIKPDVMAIGKGTWVANYESGTRQGNGTSLAAPVITGLTACLWQANPNASAMDIVESVRKSSDRFTQPDSDYGNGIPDFGLANLLLHMHESGSERSGDIEAYPNPFTGELYILFQAPVDEPVNISLVDLAGHLVFQKEYPEFPGRTYVKIDNELNALTKGVYLLRTETGGKTSVSKLMKF
jgi:serine protease AprX